MISRNKDVFFGRDALAEANRYEAALYTAVAYNRPDCVALMLKYLSPRELKKNMFFTNVDNKQCSLTASELARIKGRSGVLIQHAGVTIIQKPYQTTILMLERYSLATGNAVSQYTGI